MRPAELSARDARAVEDQAVTRPTLGQGTAIIAGWGGGPGARVSIVRPEGVEELRAAIGLATSGASQHGSAASGAIARGKGRSYGDAAQLSGGLVVDLTRLRGIELDREQGIVTAGAGVTIGELLAKLVPAGWMVPVVPGTQHVSVGGAIASDIHGKNHGLSGTFGSHVESISLLDAHGELRELSRGQADGLFEATIGGMGLTGVIVRAQFRLCPVRGPLLSVDTDRVDTLEAALAALSVPGGPYRVAWLDLLWPRSVRGVVTRAEHAAPPSREGVATVHARVAVPRRWPAGLLRSSTVRAFNALRFATAPRHERGRPEGFGKHMFPLDALDAWPRLYGAAGFLQYQLVVPTGSETVLEAVIESLRRSNTPSYLAVLKDFGPANDAPLSFPLKGWTLAMDIPRGVPGLDRLLDDFDQKVAECGGRVYLSKDSRMRPDSLKAMYPRLSDWQAARDRADPERLWCSDLARRTGLV